MIKEVAAEQLRKDESTRKWINNFLKKNFAPDKAMPGQTMGSHSIYRALKTELSRIIDDKNLDLSVGYQLTILGDQDSTIRGELSVDTADVSKVLSNDTGGFCDLSCEGDSVILNIKPPNPELGDFHAAITSQIEYPSIDQSLVAPEYAIGGDLNLKLGLNHFNFGNGDINVEVRIDAAGKTCLYILPSEATIFVDTKNIADDTKDAGSYFLFGGEVINFGPGHVFKYDADNNSLQRINIATRESAKIFEPIILGNEENQGIVELTVGHMQIVASSIRGVPKEPGQAIPNQDRCGIRDWVVVADGAGSYEDSDSVAHLLVKNIAENPESSLQERVRLAQDFIAINQLKGAAAFVAAQITQREGQLWLQHTHLGDCQLMVVPQSGDEFLSNADSVDGKLTTYVAAMSEGEINKVNLVIEERKINQDDIVILASDGLYGNLTQEQITEIVGDCNGDIKTIHDRLQERALSAMRGEGEGDYNPDNLTIVVMRANTTS